MKVALVLLLLTGTSVQAQNFPRNVGKMVVNGVTYVANSVESSWKTVSGTVNDEYGDLTSTVSNTWKSAVRTTDMIFTTGGNIWDATANMGGMILYGLTDTAIDGYEYVTSTSSYTWKSAVVTTAIIFTTSGNNWHATADMGGKILHGLTDTVIDGYEYLTSTVKYTWKSAVGTTGIIFTTGGNIWDATANMGGRILYGVTDTTTKVWNGLVRSTGLE